MIRSNKPETRARARFGGLFELSSWGSRQPWRSPETDVTTVEVRGTRKLGTGRVRVQRRPKAA